MIQLLQSIYAIAPFLFLIVLFGATFFGLWLATQLKKSSGRDEHYTVADRLFLKRNAARMRKMELH
jgi:hypothetical protein